jgi:hypothetical protein
MAERMITIVIGRETLQDLKAHSEGDRWYGKT